MPEGILSQNFNQIKIPQKTMKKFLLILSAVALSAMVSCGSAKSDKAAETKADSTEVVVDSTCCNKECKEACDSTCCKEGKCKEACDSTKCDKECKKECAKECDKACEKECEKKCEK